MLITVYSGSLRLERLIIFIIVMIKMSDSNALLIGASVVTVGQIDSGNGTFPMEIVFLHLTMLQHFIETEEMMEQLT